MAVFDEVFADLDEIVAGVARNARFAARATIGGGYPGVQAGAPGDYARALLGATAPVLAAVFGGDDGTIGEVTCSFSLVTLAPEQLHPQQTVPHIDVADPGRFAILHYLCGEPFGGTAFFRQQATGLEQVTRENWATYCEARDRALAGSEQRGYPDVDTPGYTQTATIAARRNRMIVYRSNVLHSGVIAPGIEHSADPTSGRLTGNLFARYRLASPGL